MNRRLSDRWKSLVQLYQKEIWQPGQLKRLSPQGVLYAVLRVVSITWTVFNETKALSRAAALSFSSLLGLGPLVALTVLVAGFALDNRDPNLAANTLSRLIYFVAPQVGQYGKLPHNQDEPPPSSQAAAPAAADNAAAEPPAIDPDTSPGTAAPSDNAEIADDPSADMELNPRLVRMMNNFISQGRSGSAGTIGFFSLVIIVLMLFKTVEDTFNEIWGVRSGRSLLMRVVYYWTILTLGAVLFFASVTLLSASAFLSVFEKAVARMPFSEQMALALQWSLPVFSFTLLVILLTVFYRIIPNTRVFWRAAFIGAAVVASLLMLNNYLAFLYVRRVIMTESLYGSLGFPLVVMFGLYIFWLYVLIGGQISYAVQNVHFRNSQAAWGHLSESMRERLLLIVLLTICRRFQDCQPPLAASELGSMIKVPTQILNECLNRLVDLKFITPLPAATKEDSSDLLYQPARPLNRITLHEFKTHDDNFGDNPIGTTIDQLDPILLRYKQEVAKLGERAFLQKPLDVLLAEFPFDQSRPPFEANESAGA